LAYLFLLAVCDKCVFFSNGFDTKLFIESGQTIGKSQAEVKAKKTGSLEVAKMGRCGKDNIIPGYEH
jgi:hypothetical protein